MCIRKSHIMNLFIIKYIELYGINENFKRFKRNVDKL
jgi:hypothetical protein